VTSPEELAFENLRLAEQVRKLTSLSNQQAEKLGGLSAQVTAADRLAKTLERDLARERHNAEAEIKALKEQVHRLKSDAHGEMMLREAAEARLRAVTTGVAECEGDGGCRATKTVVSEPQGEPDQAMIVGRWCYALTARGHIHIWTGNGPDQPMTRDDFRRVVDDVTDGPKLRADLAACRVERDTWLGEHGRVTAELEAKHAKLVDVADRFRALRHGVDELRMYCERHQCLDVAQGLSALLKPAAAEPQSYDDDEGIECPLVDCCQSEPCKKPKTAEKLLAQIEPERLTRAKVSTAQMLGQSLPPRVARQFTLGPYTICLRDAGDWWCAWYTERSDEGHVSNGELQAVIDDVLDLMGQPEESPVTVIDETKSNELDAAHKRYELFAGAIYWEVDRQLREGPELSKLVDILREHGGSRVPPKPGDQQRAWRDL
jgi:hypothetical protein